MERGDSVSESGVDELENEGDALTVTLTVSDAEKREETVVKGEVVCCCGETDC